MICEMIILINCTTFAWNKHDYHIIERARVTCQNEYPNSPCIKRFVKRGERDYYVQCGQAKKEEKGSISFRQVPKSSSTEDRAKFCPQKSRIKVGQCERIRGKSSSSFGEVCYSDDSR